LGYYFIFCAANGHIFSSLCILDKKNDV